MLIPGKHSQQIHVNPFSLARKLPQCPPIRTLLFLAAGLLLTLSPIPVRSQTQTPLDSPGFSVPGRPPKEDPTLRRMTRHMERERNIQRQKKIVADTAQLLNLAKELNDAVSHSTKDTLSLDVVKKADEIEKLAKTIKQKMRDGE